MRGAFPLRETTSKGGTVNEQEALRIGKTESLFREVNERVAESAARFESESAEFICECDDASCTERIEVPLAEYGAVREHGTRFLVAPGHLDPDVERPVTRRRTFVVVDKVQARVVAVVRRLNPRRAGPEPI